MENIIRSEAGLSHVYYRCQTLCRTLSGHHCPLLTITNTRRPKECKEVVSETETKSIVAEQEECNGQENIVEQVLKKDIQWKDKKYVVLTSRLHPGESNSSWVMRGMQVCALLDQFWCSLMACYILCCLCCRRFTIPAQLPVRGGRVC